VAVQPDDGWTAEGGCACGLVRYRAAGRPMFVHCCHCTSCQRETGSAFVINALYESGRITTTAGEPRAVMTPSESGQGQQIWRCPSCQVALWSNYGGKGDKIRFLRVGTLDRPEELEPDIHIYTRSRLPWVRLPEGARAVDAYYDSASTWPAESLARARAVAS